MGNWSPSIFSICCSVTTIPISSAIIILAIIICRFSSSESSAHHQRVGPELQIQALPRAIGHCVGAAPRSRRGLVEKIRSGFAFVLPKIPTVIVLIALTVMFRQKHGIAPFAYGHAILVGEVRRVSWRSAIMVCPITSLESSELARSIRLPVTAYLFICVIASKYLYL